MKHTLQYSKSKKYQVPQSSIRYKYQHEQLDPNGHKTNLLIRNSLTYNENIGDFDMYSVSSAMLITSFKIYIKIFEFWRDESHRINKWSSGFWFLSGIQTMFTNLKRKYLTKSQLILFFNIHSMYEILGYQPSSTTPYPVKTAYFRIWLAASQHQKEHQYINLVHVIEGLVKAQLIWEIPRYKSRGNRPYELPWMVTEAAAITYKKKFTSAKIKKLFNKYNVNFEGNKSKDKEFHQKSSKKDIRSYFNGVSSKEPSKRKRNDFSLSPPPSKKRKVI